ncbi:MAG: nucleotidyltransferase [Alphaproteobacteria bacterium]|nr:nucleotidyltransferase [Alphaproteobacteria bacterium]
MGVGDDFKRFCDALRIPQATRSTISSRTAQITKRLNQDFWNSQSEQEHSFYSGSYGRGTGIKGISDIDLLMQLPYETYQQYNDYKGNGQSALLQAVKNSILKTYSSTTLKGDGQVVVVSFNDMTYEVLPVFLNTDGSYTFPDSNNNGSWKQTKPKEEMAEVEKRNSETNGNLRELCRIARSWKACNNVSMSGMLVDTLAYNFIGSCQNKDKSYLYYDYISRDFFEFLKNQNSNQSYWIAPGSGQYVYASGNFTYKAGQAHRASLEAIQYANNNNTWSARQKWREIYGTDYPSSD